MQKIISKSAYLIFLIGTATATLLRTVWLLFFTDLSSGTVRSEYRYYEYVFAVLYVLLGLLAVGNSFTAKARRFLPRVGKFTGVTSFVLAACFLADALLCVMRAAGGNPVIATSSLGEWLLALLNLACALYFALVGIRSMDLADLLLNPVLPCLPLVQIVLRTLLSFFRYTRVASMGEERYMMLLLVCYAVFWVYYCRIVTGIQASERGNKMLFAPMLAFFAGVLVLFPHAVSGLTNPAIWNSGTFTFADAGTAVFALACVTRLMTLRVQQEPLPGRM